MENFQTEYICHYKNPYILQQFQKKDLRFTKQKRIQYYIINKLGNGKLFGTPKFRKIKNPFNSLLERYKKKINYEFYNYEYSYEFERKDYTEKDNINLDINFEYLYLYDILPKEDIYEFQNGLIKYSDVCKHVIGVADEISINRSFRDMANHNYRHSTHNLQYFVISDSMSSYKWIENIHVLFEEYSDSFYLITYRLKLKELATNELKIILNSLVIYEPLFIKTKNKKKLLAINNHFLPFSRQKALNELILEIEYNFINELNKYVPCFFHRHNLVAPSLGIYLIDDLEKAKSHNELKFIVNFKADEYDISKDNNLMVNFSYFGEFTSYSCFANKDFVQKQDYALETLDIYFSHLAEYYIFNTLKPVIEKSIILNQRKLNKLVAHSRSASKLLKAKIATLKELNIYKRLISANQKFEDSPYINDYMNDFENSNKSHLFYKDYRNAFHSQIDEIKEVYKNFDAQIGSLYQFYDDSLKSIESSTNIRLVRITLILTAITLLATIITILISLDIISIKKSKIEDDPNICIFRLL